MNLSIEHDGRTFPSITAVEAREAGVPNETIAAAIAKVEADQRRGDIRLRLAQGPGDTASLFGSTADSATLLFVAMARMSVALARANSLAEMRDAAEPFARLTEAVLQRIDAGEVRLPYEAKGIDAVLTEIFDRTTAVADVLAEADPE